MPKKESLLFYRRYIDNLFFIWEGNESSLQEFMSELNSNDNNIKLDYESNREQIHFLDVNILRQGDTLTTTVYFKPIDRNSYLPLSSGHRPLWLRNIPKGQMIQVRRNCTTDNDFQIQSKIIKDRFLQKGYREHDLNVIVHEVGGIPREACLRDKDCSSNSRQEWGFISNFHVQ